MFISVSLFRNMQHVTLFVSVLNNWPPKCTNQPKVTSAGVFLYLNLSSYYRNVRACSLDVCWLWCAQLGSLERCVSSLRVLMLLMLLMLLYLLFASHQSRNELHCNPGHCPKQSQHAECIPTTLHWRPCLLTTLHILQWYLSFNTGNPTFFLLLTCHTMPLYSPLGRHAVEVHARSWWKK